jgi:hypothetical protein
LSTAANIPVDPIFLSAVQDPPVSDAFAGDRSVSALYVPAKQHVVRVHGYSPTAPACPTDYIEVAAQPTHSLKFQALDGRWFEIDKSVIDVRAAGAFGDGTTDDTAAIQRAFDAAAQKYEFYPFRGNGTTYAISAPLIAPPGCVILGVKGGRSAVGMTVIKALAGFTSTLTMTHWVTSANVTYNVAGLIVSQAFRDNGTFANNLIQSVEVEGLTFDGGSSYVSGTDTNTPLYDNRGAPIHGLILMGVNVRVHRCYFNNTSGFGCWVTSMGANGLSISSLISPKITRCRTYNNGGAMTNTYTTNGGTFPYAAIHAGILHGVAEAGGGAAGNTITDGVIDNIEQADPCYGAGISIESGGSWSITKIHINQPGHHGIMLGSGFITRVSDCMIDGWGKRAAATTGAYAGIAVLSMTNGGTISVSDVDIRYATPANLTGNTFSFMKIVGRLSTDRTAANIQSCRFLNTPGADSTVPFIFDLTSTGATAVTFRFQVQNCIDFGSSHVFAAALDPTKIDVWMDNNSWQLLDNPPSNSKWWPAGYRMYKRAPTTGDIISWRKATASTANDWVVEGSPSQPGKNYVDNASLEIAQAGTSFAVAATTDTQLIDRFKTRRGSTGMTISRQTGFSLHRFAMRVQRNNADITTGACNLFYQLPSAVVAELAGKTVIFGVDARVGANYSGGNMTALIVTGTGTDEALTMSGTPGFTTGNVSSGSLLAATPTTTAARFTSASYAVPSTATELAIQIGWTPAGTAGAADYLELAGFKLEVGDQPTRYEPEVREVTLQRCQHFYQKSFLQATAPVQSAGAATGEHRAIAGKAAAVAVSLGTVRFNSPMRIAPTITLFNPAAANAQVRDITGAVDCSASAGGNITEQAFEITCTGNAATAVGNVLGVHWTADARL